MLFSTSYSIHTAQAVKCTHFKKLSIFLDESKFVKAISFVHKKFGADRFRCSDVYRYKQTDKQSIYIEGGGRGFVYIYFTDDV